MYVTDNHASLHLWQEENLLKSEEVSKYYDHDCTTQINFCIRLGVPLFEFTRMLLKTPHPLRYKTVFVMIVQLEHKNSYHSLNITSSLFLIT